MSCEAEAFRAQADKVCQEVLRHNIRQDFTRLETRLCVRGQIRERMAGLYSGFARSGVVELTRPSYANNECKGFTVKVMASTALKFERTYSIAFLFKGT